jgi:sulfoxide reductase heme-binding subunit YedZ
MAARLRWLKPVVFVAVVVPVAGTAFRLLTGRLGANPIAEAMNELGLWTLIWLLASLGCTPLKILFGWTWPLRLRRLLGVTAFVYASMHFVVYVAVDQFFSWPDIWEDIAKRKFITVGFAALVLLLPLAITSTNKMVKRLGYARWKRLHRLVYAAAVLGVIHFLWRVKADPRTPIIYGLVLTFLLGVRVFGWLRDRRSPSARSS